MEFRITQQYSMNASIRQAQLRQQQIAELQNDLATGLRIHRPSDAPNDWGSLVRYKSSSGRMEVDLQNISTVRHQLNQSVSSLTEAGNVLVRARELAIAGPQSQERETLASEVDRLIDSMLAIANSGIAGIRLYSGTASDEKPFVITSEDENGRPLRIDYQGAVDPSEVIVGPGLTASVLPTGSQVFQQRTRGETIYIGSTGAKMGIGTDNATGFGTLTITHTESIYAGGGVAAGLSSNAEDTIIGPAGSNVLQIDDDPTLGRVVRLNDGEPFKFDSTSSDLLVVGRNGEKAYVDLSAVAASFTGEVSITANGTMSIDGGTSETPIDFSENQVVTNSVTGEVTVVDATNVRLAGTDRVEYSGTNGVFEALMHLRDDLRSRDDYTSTEFQTIMDARLSDIERVHHQMMEFVGEQAVELSNMETLENRTRELRLSTEEAVIELENADVADVIVRLQTEQNHLQFIYATTASISQNSLLDFIR